MLQAREQRDFAGEPRFAARIRNVRVEDLDGDVPIVLEIFRQVHRGVSASADLALDFVPAAESRPESSDRIDHGTPANWVL